MCGRGMRCVRVWEGVCVCGRGVRVCLGEVCVRVWERCACVSGRGVCACMGEVCVCVWERCSCVAECNANQRHRHPPHAYFSHTHAHQQLRTELMSTNTRIVLQPPVATRIPPSHAHTPPSQLRTRTSPSIGALPLPKVRFRGGGAIP